MDDHTARAVIDRFEEYEATIAPIHNVADILADEHYQARDAVVEVPDDQLGAGAVRTPCPASPETPEITHLGPQLGAHNEAVYGERLSYDDETLAGARLGGRDMIEYPSDVTLVEMLPRDGFQRLDEFVPTDEKVEIIDALSRDWSRRDRDHFLHPPEGGPDAARRGRGRPTHRAARRRDVPRAGAERGRDGALRSTPASTRSTPW